MSCPGETNMGLLWKSATRAIYFDFPFINNASRRLLRNFNTRCAINIFNLGGFRSRVEACFVLFFRQWGKCNKNLIKGSFLAGVVRFCVFLLFKFK